MKEFFRKDKSMEKGNYSFTKRVKKFATKDNLFVVNFQEEEKNTNKTLLFIMANGKMVNMKGKGTKSTLIKN
jgi:hypothetical protein